MAVYILMQKEYEDETKVVYRYGPDEESKGRIGYDKARNVLLDIEPVRDPQISDGFYFRIAAQRLAVLGSKHKKTGFPDRTSIQS